MGDLNQNFCWPKVTLPPALVSFCSPFLLCFLVLWPAAHTSEIRSWIPANTRREESENLCHIQLIYTLIFHLLSIFLNMILMTSCSSCRKLSVICMIHIRSLSRTGILESTEGEVHKTPNSTGLIFVFFFLSKQSKCLVSLL